MLLAEEITITSYYPSPYGIYNELRAKKMAIGDDYIDSGDYTWESADGDGGEVDHNADLVVEGNVGIGTTNPLYVFTVVKDIAGNVDPIAGFLNPSLPNGNFIYNAIGKSVSSNNAGLIGFTQNATSSKIWLGLWGDDVAGAGTGLTIIKGGNVGIGTTSPSYKLHVAGDIYASGSITAVSCCSSSDKRWKKNIVVLDNPLEKLLRLKGVKFDWRQKEFKDKNFVSGRQIGIIAQEMEKEFPELVMTDKEGYKSIAYDKFTAVLLEAIKEQENKINSQQAVIKSLETKYNFLKSRLDKLERYLEYK